MQAKVAPEVQGRVFAAVDQLVTLLSLGTYLVAGPLADWVSKPAVGQPGWEVVAPLVGNGRGAGMGLMCVIGGVLTVLDLTGGLCGAGHPAHGGRFAGLCACGTCLSMLRAFITLKE